MSAMAAEPRLFDGLDDIPELATKVRSSDGDASWEAAAQMTRADEGVLKQTILQILHEHGALTSDDVHAHFVELVRSGVLGDTKLRTPNRVRTALAEMAATHQPKSQLLQVPLVRRTGQYGESGYGNRSEKWEAIS